MPLPPDVAKRMDEGAAHARVELEANWQNWNAVDVARWIQKWVRRKVGGTLPGTNYDRAARLLVEVTGVSPKRILDDADDLF